MPTLRDHLRASVADQAASTQGPDGKLADLDTSLDEAVPAVEALIAEQKALYKRMGLVSDAFAISGVGSRFDDRLTGEQLGWGSRLPTWGGWACRRSVMKVMAVTKKAQRFSAG